MLGKVKDYFVGASKEFQSIKWPTTQDTRALTIVVIAMSLAVAAFLGAFDYIFVYILQNFVI